jgi:YggT family protein
MPTGNSIITDTLGLVLQLVYSLLNLYVWVLVVTAVLSWLVAFEIINPYNKLVRAIGDLCYRLTEPALRPIRYRLPLINGIDLSFIVLMAIIWLIQGMIGILMRHLVL